LRSIYSAVNLPVVGSAHQRRWRYAEHTAHPPRHVTLVREAGIESHATRGRVSTQEQHPGALDPTLDHVLVYWKPCRTLKQRLEV
jgi:hypothetical protein